MKTYTAVFALDDWRAPNPVHYRTVIIEAKDHNDMVRQVKALIAPAGYSYIGTRDDNTWPHLPKGALS
jgi:hypothetical protein